MFPTFPFDPTEARVSGTVQSVNLEADVHTIWHYFLNRGGTRVVGVGVGLLLQDLLNALWGSTLRKLLSVVGGAEMISGSPGLGHRLWLQVDRLVFDNVCNGI